MKKVLSVLSIFFVTSLQAQNKHSFFDTSKIIGFISFDSSYNNIKSFRGYVVMYNPSDKELDAYKDGSRVKIKKMPEEKLLDEHKHKLLYSVISWYFVDWK